MRDVKSTWLYEMANEAQISANGKLLTQEGEIRSRWSSE